MSGHRHLFEGIWWYTFISSFTEWCCHRALKKLTECFACRLCEFTKLSSAESGTVNFDDTLNNHLLWADMEKKSACCVLHCTYLEILNTN